MEEKQIDHKEILPCGHENTFSHVIATTAIATVAMGIISKVDPHKIEGVLIALINDIFAEANIKLPPVPRSLVPEESFIKSAIH